MVSSIKKLYQMYRLISICVAIVLFNGCKSNVENEKNVGLPNIVFIFTDDLGYGDLGCFGAKDIKTPNIDRLASEGIKFTEFYSASPLCSPSRAGLLTGRLPQRMGINDVFFPESWTGMPPNEFTMAELLKEKNYVTGIIGKWHLGHRTEYLPQQQGFDYYFGIPYSNDMESLVYMRGNEVQEHDVDQRYITKRYTDEALRFIEKNKEENFFLYLAHNMPHVPIYASPNFIGTSERGLYGDVVQELDWSVGKVLAKLEEENILDNTLVIFSSDNGPWLSMKEFGGSAGELREGKNFTFEGGMRVPTVAMWKNKIPGGIVYKDLATQLDWFPTFARLAGIHISENHVIDGADISTVLFNEGTRQDTTYIYYNRETAERYRKGDWKIKLPYPGNEASFWKQKVSAHDTLLFNLKKDSSEKNSLFDENKDFTRNLAHEMNKKIDELGPLPISLVVRTDADLSHLKILENRELKKIK